jgi:DNA-binding cell septation regulator SpoVG
VEISIEWHGEQFNLSLATKEGIEPFLSVKGCRIVSGSKGEFISYPSRKMDSGKYWNHVYGSEKFNAVVLSKANESRPRGR